MNRWSNHYRVKRFISSLVEYNWQGKILQLVNLRLGVRCHDHDSEKIKLATFNIQKKLSILEWNLIGCWGQRQS